MTNDTFREPRRISVRDQLVELRTRAYAPVQGSQSREIEPEPFVCYATWSGQERALWRFHGTPDWPAWETRAAQQIARENPFGWPLDRGGSHNR